MSASWPRYFSAILDSPGGKSLKSPAAVSMACAKTRPKRLMAVWMIGVTREPNPVRKISLGPSSGPHSELGKARKMAWTTGLVKVPGTVSRARTTVSLVPGTVSLVPETASESRCRM